jgi:SnoaL-like protein
VGIGARTARLTDAQLERGHEAPGLLAKQVPRELVRCPRRGRFRRGGRLRSDTIVGTLARVLERWIEGYVRAWNSNDPDAIGALFTDDALYHTEPFAAPWRGRAEIVEGWLERKDEQGAATFDWQPLVVTPDLSIATGTATYHEPPHIYSNLWLVRLDPDGRCREFTEWWMEHPAER